MSKDKLKNWNEFFVNEDHKEGKESQSEWICKVVKKMSEEEVKKVYDFIEKEFDMK